MDSTTTDRPCVCILRQGGVSCPVSAAWHSFVTTHWSKYHCYNKAQSRYDLRCLKATLIPNKHKQTNKKEDQPDCKSCHKFTLSNAFYCFDGFKPTRPLICNVPYMETF